jgi:hypothetical protein
MEYTTKTRLPLHSNGIICPFAITPHHSQIGIIFHSYLLVPMGAKVKRALKSLRFWRLIPKGEKVLSPKAKGPHHHLILLVFRKFFNLYLVFNWYVYFQLVPHHHLILLVFRKIFNWYLVMSISSIGMFIFNWYI